ncbi:MAG: hypothetical protein H3C27_13560 [Opitutaceae bacterium]|nr:hypothetical protein [Opitutaceae bacterium]
MPEKKRAKLSPELSAIVARNIRLLLQSRGWKSSDLAQVMAVEMASDSWRRDINCLRQLRPRLNDKRAFMWRDLPVIARVLQVSEERLRWPRAENGEYHTGALSLAPDVTLTTPERRQVEDAVGQSRRFLARGAQRNRRLLKWPGKLDQLGWDNIHNDKHTPPVEREAGEFARYLRDTWQLGVQPLASLPWLYTFAGGVRLTLERADFAGWPGLAPFYYNTDRVVVVTAGYASLPAAAQRYYWARALGWFVAGEFVEGTKPLDRFARALLLPDGLRDWCAGIRHEPAALGDLAATFGVDAETLTRRLYDWRQILSEKQRLKLRRSVEVTLAQAPA